MTYHVCDIPFTRLSRGRTQIAGYSLVIDFLARHRAGFLFLQIPSGVTGLGEMMGTWMGVSPSPQVCP